MKMTRRDLIELGPGDAAAAHQPLSVTAAISGSGSLFVAVIPLPLLQKCQDICRDGRSSRCYFAVITASSAIVCGSALS
jgi:hypothetical protein